jgi:plasmid stabilization system protein ParE
MKVNWTQKARQRLQQLYGYIAEDQPANALQFIDQLTRRAELLAAHPRSGTISGKFTKVGIGSFTAFCLTASIS